MCTLLVDACPSYPERAPAPFCGRNAPVHLCRPSLRCGFYLCTCVGVRPHVPSGDGLIDGYAENIFNNLTPASKEVTPKSTLLFIYSLQVCHSSVSLGLFFFLALNYSVVIKNLFYTWDILKMISLLTDVTVLLKLMTFVFQHHSLVSLS